MTTPNNFRGYSISMVEQVEASTSDSVGMRLARACIRRRIPVAVVAKRLGVSRFAVYQWFSGSAMVRKSRLPKVMDFLAELEAQ